MSFAHADIEALLARSAKALAKTPTNISITTNTNYYYQPTFNVASPEDALNAARTFNGVPDSQCFSQEHSNQAPQPSVTSEQSHQLSAPDHQRNVLQYKDKPSNVAIYKENGKNVNVEIRPYLRRETQCKKIIHADTAGIEFILTVRGRPSLSLTNQSRCLNDAVNGGYCAICTETHRNKPYDRKPKQLTAKHNDTKQKIDDCESIAAELQSALTETQLRSELTSTQLQSEVNTRECLLMASEEKIDKLNQIIANLQLQLDHANEIIVRQNSSVQVGSSSSSPHATNPFEAPAVAYNHSPVKPNPAFNSWSAPHYNTYPPSSNVQPNYSLSLPAMNYSQQEEQQEWQQAHHSQPGYRQ
jgi:hypothetical protein